MAVVPRQCGLDLGISYSTAAADVQVCLPRRNWSAVHVFAVQSVLGFFDLVGVPVKHIKYHMEQRQMEGAHA